MGYFVHGLHGKFLQRTACLILHHFPPEGIFGLSVLSQQLDRLLYVVDLASNKRNFFLPIDQTVLLCVDQVLTHHCKKDTVGREFGEEVEKVEDQNTTSANET